jgi:hypothetical protein
MDNTLYEAALQVVPLLLIALFLDRRIDSPDPSPGARRWHRWSNKFSLLLNALAFLLSLLVVSGIVQPSSLTIAIVISAVAGSIGLLIGQIWQRLDQP